VTGRVCDGERDLALHEYGLGGDTARVEDGHLAGWIDVDGVAPFRRAHVVNPYRVRTTPHRPVHRVRADTCW
jgi:hypothetical protein